MNDDDRFHLLDLVAAMERHTLEWEKEPAHGKTALHLLFQGAHNLKSGLAMAAFQKTSQSVHAVESLLDGLRRGKVTWSPGLGESILGTIDGVRSAIEDDQDRDVVLEGHRESSETGRQAAPAEGRRLYRIDKLFKRGLAREDFDDLPIFEDIATAGRLISLQPDFEQYASGPEDCVISFTFESVLAPEQLAAVFYDPLIPLDEPAPAPAVENPLATRILIVEDDPLGAIMLTQFLQAHGSCRLAKDGREALSAFREAFLEKTPFHLVVLDLDIPLVSGDQVLRQMRGFEESQGIFGLDRSIIVINTVTTDTDQVFKSFREQADGYFIKPLSLTGITRSLASVEGKLAMVLRRLRARESQGH